VNNSLEIRRSLQAEQRVEKVQDLWSNWLKSKGLVSFQPERDRNGLWRLVLPARVFRSSQANFSEAEIGTYHIEQGYFVQIWCDDEHTRLHAALDRTLKMIQASRQTVTQERIQDMLQQMAEQLQIVPPPPREIYPRAKEKNLDSDLLEILQSMLYNNENE
jgi:hypothetical protein